MSHGVHMTREPDSVISEPDWFRLVETEPDLRRGADFTETTNPRTGEVIRIGSLNLVEWLGHPSGQMVPLNYSRGRVTALNPDDATIERMRSLARELGARVVGDEGESYD
jgi:hypothetical protein